MWKYLILLISFNSFAVIDLRSSYDSCKDLVIHKKMDIKNTNCVELMNYYNEKIDKTVIVTYKGKTITTNKYEYYSNFIMTKKEKLAGLIKPISLMEREAKQQGFLSYEELLNKKNMTKQQAQITCKNMINYIYEEKSNKCIKWCSTCKDSIISELVQHLPKEKQKDYFREKELQALSIDFYMGNYND